VVRDRGLGDERASRRHATIMQLGAGAAPLLGSGNQRTRNASGKTASISRNAWRRFLDVSTHSTQRSRNRIAGLLLVTIREGGLLR
jgi:hypothetical protein